MKGLESQAPSHSLLQDDGSSTSFHVCIPGMGVEEEMKKDVLRKFPETGTQHFHKYAHVQSSGDRDLEVLDFMLGHLLLWSK